MNEKLVKIVREKIDSKSNGETEKIISAVLISIMETLNEEEKLRFSVGTFKTIFRKEKVGRNPRTKEQIIIPARKTISFKPAKLVKELLNSTNE